MSLFGVIHVPSADSETKRDESLSITTRQEASHFTNLPFCSTLFSRIVLCIALLSMPFLYVYVCDLLEDLGCLVYRDCPMLVGLEKETNNRTVNWFKRHKNRLNEFSVDARAVMMFFHPEKHIDRDYGLDAERLEQLIARVLNLPRNLHTELQMWRNGPVYGDLAACVQRVMEKMAGVRIQITRVTVVFPFISSLWESPSWSNAYCVIDVCN